MLGDLRRWVYPYVVEFFTAHIALKDVNPSQRPTGCNVQEMKVERTVAGRARAQEHFPTRGFVPTERFLKVLTGYLLHELSLEVLTKNYGDIFRWSAVANVGEAIRKG